MKYSVPFTHLYITTFFPVTQYKGLFFTQNTGVSRLCWKYLAFPLGIGDDSDLFFFYLLTERICVARRPDSWLIINHFIYTTKSSSEFLMLNFLLGVMCTRTVSLFWTKSLLTKRLLLLPGLQPTIRGEYLRDTVLCTNFSTVWHAKLKDKVKATLCPKFIQNLFELLLPWLLGMIDIIKKSKKGEYNLQWGNVMHFSR